jgi:colanic acid biosynthesis glycosyl transferase WcaI
MRIVVHDFGGYPFSIQLSRALADRGHQVLHLVANGFRMPKGPVEPREHDTDALRIELVTLREAMREGGLGRLRQERRYGRLASARAAAFRPDVVMSANSPLSVQQALLDVAHRNGAGFVFWLQDLHSIAIGRILARRMGIAGRLIGRAFERLERRLLRKSEAVVAISSDFVSVLTAWQIPRERVSVAENWAPIDDAAPASDEGSWARRLRLPSGPLVLYAGTLALKHNPALLVELARGLPNAVVAVVAEGSGAAWLRQHAASVGNLHVLPLQPYHEVAHMLAAADLLVAVLEPDASSFSAPSKVLTYLAAGRPVLAAMPGDNPAARLILRIGAGRVVDPSPPSALVDAARHMLDSPASLQAAGAAGNAYARQAFDIGTITDEFERILQEAVDRKSHSEPTIRADTGHMNDASDEAQG